ncbi:class I SAM-dependent methyltransferase [Marivirga tractuosa]|uniref:class I SAM-dependent methyltransferase n=1 Tax=Marivirga tractuosa TaxID=1006 RepID=UPI0035CF7813
MGVEKSETFYDQKFGSELDYQNHYKNSWYYVHWTQIIKYLKKFDKPKILEVGCGTGQLAEYLSDEGYKYYCGFDFSAKAIEIAKNRINLDFFVGNALDKKSFEKDYNFIICTEVLEHIKDDYKVLNNIEVGSNIIFSVPNFDEESHVRWFLSERQIKRRYFRHIEIKDITRIGNIYIVLGIRSNFNPNILQTFFATRENISINSFTIRLKHRIKNFLKIKRI